MEGHGNFGSPTDSAASMRYTEARLTPLAEELFADIEVATLIPNYSGDKHEPLVLPSRIPLLLLNGSSGIGVALRATLPPHNLRELIRVLVYYIKKENPSLSTILKHLPGPDYGYGILLSSSEEVKALYESGAGSLSYRCDYHFEKTKTCNLLVVKSLAPGFNMGSFLSKMRKLSDEGLILSCSDGTNAEGVRIYVEFSDPVVLKERILPELHTTQSYQFYVVKRAGEDNDIGEDSLFSGGLLRLFDEFVSFRREVENLRLNRELKKEKASLFRAKALLSAIRNLHKVYEVLKQSHQTSADLSKSLAAALGIKEKQAQFILDMKVQQLSRMNESSQSEKISSIRNNIASIKEDLDNIDEVIVRSLKSLLRFSDARGTRLESEVDSPEISIKASKKYLIAQGNKVTRLDREPSRRHKFDLLCSASSSVTMVLSNNEAHTMSLAYLTEEAFSHNVVGFVPDLLPTIAVDASGMYVVVNTPEKTFNLMRGATSIVSAAPLYPNGRVVFVLTDGTAVFCDSSSLEATRTFVRGRKLSLPIERVIAIPKGHDLYSKDGKKLVGEELSLDGHVYVISDRNFVIVNDDKRDVLDLPGVLTLLKSFGAEKSFPL